MNMEQWSKRKEQERYDQKNARQNITVTRKRVIGWKLLPTDYLTKKVVKIIRHDFSNSGAEQQEGEKNYKQQNKF